MSTAAAPRRRGRRALGSAAAHNVELAGAGEIGSIVTRVVDDETVSTDELLLVLDAVRRRARTAVDGQSRADTIEAMVASAEALQDALVAREVTERRQAVRSLERREPLRTRVLDALRQPRTPKEVTDLLGSSQPQVSRLLRELAADALVTAARDPDDGRRKIYVLSEAGEAELVEHEAFGARPPVPPLPTRDETVAYLGEALVAAVDFRRRTNRLDDVERRLRSVLDQTQRLDAGALALSARAELAATLRQASRAEERAEQISALDEVARTASSELALPAFAHVEYELGRAARPGDHAGPIERSERLVTAHQIFERLGTERADRALLLKSALAEAGLADLWRDETDLDRAILWGSRALERFVELDDEYGIARARLTLGHCFRLRGQFEEAWTNLEQVHAVAAEHDFERYMASVLAQMGEVKRCVGAFEDATELLTEACRYATRVGTVTYAFAQSALGATRWKIGDVDQAIEHFEAADRDFASHQHVSGLALNLRRRAVVEARCNATGGKPGQRLRTALATYERLRSPAGAAACVIELGRLSLGRRRSPSYLPRLRRLLREGSISRLLIEMDPWVPRMLVAFAEAIDDDALHATAVAVERGSDQRRKEQKEQTAHSIATTASATVAHLRRRHQDIDDPMAGEPRRQLTLMPGAA